MSVLFDRLLIPGLINQLAYENGYSTLLLHLVGTLPVTFRGTLYNFPLDIWIPHAYPFDPPIVYVTPTSDMVVRVGQHVTLEGKLYHHYLAHWAEAWDVSQQFISDLIHAEHLFILISDRRLLIC